MLSIHELAFFPRHTLRVWSEVSLVSRGEFVPLTNEELAHRSRRGLVTTRQALRDLLDVRAVESDFRPIAGGGQERLLRALDLTTDIARVFERLELGELKRCESRYGWKGDRRQTCRRLAIEGHTKLGFSLRGTGRFCRSHKQAEREDIAWIALFRRGARALTRGRKPPHLTRDEFRSLCVEVGAPQFSSVDAGRVLRTPGAIQIAVRGGWLPRSSLEWERESRRGAIG